MAKETQQRRYKDSTIKLLWGKSGGLCAFPNCANELNLRSTNDVIGHIAHIVAHSPNWTRGDAKYPEPLLNEYDNLILLCQHHHAVIDVKSSTYTVDDLRRMKKEHENRIERLFKVGKPWQSNVYHLYYVNIPRLAILSAVEGVRIEHPFLSKVHSLHELGFELVFQLTALERIVNTITPQAIPLSEFTGFSHSDLGKYCSYDGTFRTKNGPSIKAARDGFLLTGNIKTDPHIYQKVGKWKFIMVYDPAWITTSTSFVALSPTGGSNRFSGLCFIKNVNVTAKEVYATPLLIGLPRTPSLALMDAMFSS